MDTTDTRVAELLAEWIEAEVAGHRLGERLRALRLEQERLANGKCASWDDYYKGRR